MKTYIGDGVYVDVVEGEVILTTEDGLTVTNVIYLDATVWQTLVHWVAKYAPLAAVAPQESTERELWADHSVALEFVREMAADDCPIECGTCRICRARAWLHTPRAAQGR